VIVTPSSFVCSISICLRHDSLSAVAWTRDGFLRVGVLGVFGWAIRFLRRDRAAAVPQPAVLVASRE